MNSTAACGPYVKSRYPAAIEVARENGNSSTLYARILRLVRPRYAPTFRCSFPFLRSASETNHHIIDIE